MIPPIYQFQDYEWLEWLRYIKTIQNVPNGDAKTGGLR